MPDYLNQKSRETSMVCSTDRKEENEAAGATTKVKRAIHSNNIYHFPTA